MRSNNRMGRAIMACGLGCLLVLVSCGGSETTSSAGDVVDAVAPSSTSTPEAMPSSTSTPEATSDDLAFVDEVEVDDAADEASALEIVTNEGVLDAAIIILSDGDLEAALTDGRVTEPEVESAIVALENGTLGDYVD